MSRKLDGLVALRGRAGFASGANLIYATGGVAQGHIDHRFTTSNGANRFTQTDESQATGYQVGGGYERRLTDRVSLGVEYIYTNLKDDGHTVRAQGPVAATNPFILRNPAGTDFQRTEEDVKVHSFRVTAGWRF